jgi:8-oxo-dGTP diphosphatase
MLERMETVTVIKALVLDKNGHCLVLRRSKSHPTMAHQPDLPGGRIEAGEAHTDALVRELHEEIGLTVTVQSMQMVYASADVFAGKNFVRLIALVRLGEVPPKVTLSWEHDSAAWLPLAEVEAYLEHPVYKRALAYITNHDLA